MQRTRLRHDCSSGMACSSTAQQAVCTLATSGVLMMKPVVVSPIYLRGRREDDQRNVCNGGCGRGDKRERGRRQRVDARNRANGGSGRIHKGRKGLQDVRLDRPVPYSKDHVMLSGIDGVSEISEGEYEEACRLSCKRAAIWLHEMTGDTHLDRVARVMVQRQKAKESEDALGRVLAGPSPLELQLFAGTAWNSRPTVGGSSI